MSPRRLDEFSGLFDTGGEGEDFLDDQGFVDFMDLERGERAAEIAGLGVEVDAGEVERFADLGSIEQGFSPFGGIGPGITPRVII